MLRRHASSTVRETIDARAFQLPLSEMPELSEHVQGLLTTAGLVTFGDLLLQSKLDADAILAYEGVGPKTHEDLMSLVENYKFPEIEQPVVEVVEIPEPVVEEPVAIEEPAQVVEVEVEQPVETAPVAVEVETVEASEEKSFEELFKLESLRRANIEQPVLTDAEELAMGADKKGKTGKGKKKKSFTVEYDPDRDADVILRKHKGDADWENW